MTDAQAKAREIARWFFHVDDPQQDECMKMIADALEAERKAGYLEGQTMKESILTECRLADAEGYRRGLEEAAGIVHGEIEVYEEQSRRVNTNRLKKIQKRWVKLKEIENRIRRRLQGVK